MSNDNKLEFQVSIKRDGVGELAQDLTKVESSAEGAGKAGAQAGTALDRLEDAAKQAGTGLDQLAAAEGKAEQRGAQLSAGVSTAGQGMAAMGQTAAQAGQGLAEMGVAANNSEGELAGLRKAVDAKTQAIKAGLQVEQSEIELQRQHLAAARAEQQARLQAAQAQGDEAAATQAGNALRQIESDQLALVARSKGAEASAIQQTTDARRELLAAVGPLTAAQTQELQVAENLASALRVEGAAADQASLRARELADSSTKAGSELDVLRKAVDAKTQAIKTRLQVEQSEIDLQRQHLAAAKAEQQARLQAAQAQGDEAAATRAGNALRQIESDQLALVARAKRAEATAIQQATDARREELAAVGPLTAAQDKELQAAENLAKALRVEAAAADQASQRARELGTAHQRSASAADQLNGRIANLTQMLGQMAAALGAAFTFREMVTAAAQMEQLRSGLAAVTGDAEKAGKELEFVRVVASRIGSDVTEVGKAFLGLSAATRGTAVEGEPTRQVFEAVAAAMGKAGKSSAETGNALMALSQMASKGVVQSEELRGQLGEALPGALNAAAKGLGLTTAEMMKLVEEGKITAQDIFPALAQGLNELYGGAPQAQTLSQEFVNVKNAAVDMSDRIGQAGGLRVLKVGAELAQAAILLLGEGLVTTGQKIGVLMGALATLDFKGVKQALADIEAESRDKLLKAAQHNGVLRDAIMVLGSDAEKTALAQREQAQATTSSAAAASQASPAWVKLQSDYGKVTESIREQIAETDKSVIARNAEGKAAVALAEAFGTEREQRAAQVKAAEDNATALNKLAALKATELAVMKAELDALQALYKEKANQSPERKKEIEELQKKVDLRQQDTDKAVAQAQASRLAVEQAKAEAEANKDNSKRVIELREAWERARQELERVRAAKAAGKATTEELEKAELAAGKAAYVYRDALQDQLKTIEAKRNLAQADIDVQSATVRVAIEQQKAIYEVAKARGDERTAMAAQNEIRRLEIELLTLSAQAKRLEADAAIATAQAKKAELIASGEYTGAKRLEIEAAIKSAEVKRKEADIADITANKLRNLARVQSDLKNSADKATDSINNQADAMERLGDGVQKVGSGYRNKDGFTSDAKGNVQSQFQWTRASIIDYLKQAGLDEKVAAELSKQFLDANGNVPYEASDVQKKWGGTYGTLASALGKMAEYYKYDDGGKQEAAYMLEFANGKDKPTKPAPGPSPAPGPAPAPAPGPAPSPGQGGNTYINNITINGVEPWGFLNGTTSHTSKQSADTEVDLMRKLAQAKGVAQ